MKAILCYIVAGASLGSKPVPLKDQIRENKRSLDRAIREIDRERLKLERQQTRIQNDIRKAAKTGQQVSSGLIAWCIVPLIHVATTGSSEDYGKRLREDQETNRENDANACPTSGHWFQTHSTWDGGKYKGLLTHVALNREWAPLKR